MRWDLIRHLVRLDRGGDCWDDGWFRGSGSPAIGGARVM